MLANELVSGNIYYLLTEGFSRTTVVKPEIEEFAVSRRYIFVTFRNKVDIIVHYDNTPFWISADTNKGVTLKDPECPILL